MATKITDFAATVRLGQSFGPAETELAEITGGTVDLVDTDGPAFAVLNVAGDVGSASISAIVQSSPDDSTWTDVPDAGFPALDGVGVRAITFMPPARYLRVNITIDGAADPIALDAIIGQSRKIM